MEAIKFDKNGPDAEDFENAEKIAKVAIGKKNLYFKKMLSWYYIPFDGIERMFRRVNECASRVGCCSNDFSVHKLVAVIHDEEFEVLIGEGLYRHEPEQVLDAIRSIHPEMKIAVH